MLLYKSPLASAVFRRRQVTLHFSRGSTAIRLASMKQRFVLSSAGLERQTLLPQEELGKGFVLTISSCCEHGATCCAGDRIKIGYIIYIYWKKHLQRSEISSQVEESLELGVPLDALLN